MSGIKVTVTSLGGSVEVEVPEGSNPIDACREAGIDADAQGLQTAVNGDSGASTLADGDSVSASPRNAKLG